MALVTVTSNVREIFNSLFPSIKDKRKRTSTSCGVCDGCLRNNCGVCNSCKQMEQFGGSGSANQPLLCIERTCRTANSNSAPSTSASNERSPLVRFFMQRKFRWEDVDVKRHNSKYFYNVVYIENIKYKVGDFIFCQGSSDVVPEILRIEFMWSDPKKDDSLGFFHGSVYKRSEETILGQVGDSQFIYLVDACYEECPVTVISSKAKVAQLDGDSIFTKKKAKNVLYLSKYYNAHNCAFEDLPKESELSGSLGFCNTCDRKKKRYLQLLPAVGSLITDSEIEEYDSVLFKNEILKRGCGIFIYPNTEFTTFGRKSHALKVMLENNDIVSGYDEKIFTEIHKWDNSKKETIVESFRVGIIKNIFKDSGLVKLNLFEMKRAEEYNTNISGTSFSKLYVTGNTITVCISETAGLCNIILRRNNIPNDTKLREWVAHSTKNFYFESRFEDSKEIFEIPNKFIEFIEKHSNRFEDDNLETLPEGKSSKKRTSERTKSSKMQPLRMMDLFAGCGGLSKGIEQSGAAVSCWAIENCQPAAESYQSNFPNCTVFNADCNEFLKQALKLKKGRNFQGKQMPLPGEVDIITGGPPCQGWTGLNRFATRDFAVYQNSLLATFLSYCDYYKPKYIIFENVKNFSIVKKGVVLKLTLKCLLELGYQCTAVLVDCGSYGVPQRRKRVIIFGAAPGIKLPHFPKPTHSFDFSFENTFNENDFADYARNSCSGPAPKRSVTLYDAFYDLDRTPTPVYKYKPKNDFQAQLRGSCEEVEDHVCKPISSTSQERIKHIPKDIIGADWRFLPNKKIKLSNGKVLLKLIYTHFTNNKKGVCSCFIGDECDPKYQQKSTLIPWGYVHTSERHANWPGVYGRLCWNGTCDTLLCDPDPSRTHGRVIHPDTDRILSVREYARAQGFPDQFKFCGTVEQRYKQIGNAVPVPLALAIGKEIELSKNWNLNSEIDTTKFSYFPRQ